MVQVYKIKDSRYYTLQDNEIIVELPHFKALIFNIEKAYFRIKIKDDYTLDNSFEDFIYNSDDYDDVVDSAITKYLTGLTYNNLYVTDKSIDEIINKFNSLYLEEIVWLNIKEEILEKLRVLYLYS